MEGARHSWHPPGGIHHGAAQCAAARSATGAQALQSQAGHARARLAGRIERAARGRPRRSQEPPDAAAVQRHPGNVARNQDRLQRAQPVRQWRPRPHHQARGRRARQHRAAEASAAAGHRPLRQRPELQSFRPDIAGPAVHLYLQRTGRRREDRAGHQPVSQDRREPRQRARARPSRSSSSRARTVSSSSCPACRIRIRSRA